MTKGCEEKGWNQAACHERGNNSEKHSNLDIKVFFLHERRPYPLKQS